MCHALYMSYLWQPSQQSYKEATTIIHIKDLKSKVIQLGYNQAGSHISVTSTVTIAWVPVGWKDANTLPFTMSHVSSKPL